MINLEMRTCQTICVRGRIPKKSSQTHDGSLPERFRGRKRGLQAQKKATEMEERMEDAGIEVWVNYGTSRKKIVNFKENKGLGARVGKMYLKGNDHR